MWISVSGSWARWRSLPRTCSTRHRVRARVAWLEPRERTEQARRLADVGRFEPQVVIEVGAIAVTALALAIGQPAERQQIRRLEQPHAIVERQPLARVDLVGDVGEPRGRQACARHFGPAASLRTFGLTVRQPPDLGSHRSRAQAHRARPSRTRCHWPSTSSPPLICSVSEWPSSIARRVRIGVLPVAVRVIRIVVQVVLVARDHVFEKLLDVDVRAPSATR